MVIIVRALNTQFVILLNGCQYYYACKTYMAQTIIIFYLRRKGGDGGGGDGVNCTAIVDYLVVAAAVARVIFVFLRRRWHATFLHHRTSSAAVASPQLLANSLRSLQPPSHTARLHIIMIIIIFIYPRAYIII